MKSFSILTILLVQFALLQSAFAICGNEAKYDAKEDFTQRYPQCGTPVAAAAILNHQFESNSLWSLYYTLTLYPKSNSKLPGECPTSVEYKSEYLTNGGRCQLEALNLTQKSFAPQPKVTLPLMHDVHVGDRARYSVSGSFYEKSIPEFDRTLGDRFFVKVQGIIDGKPAVETNNLGSHELYRLEEYTFREFNASEGLEQLLTCKPEHKVRVTVPAGDFDTCEVEDGRGSYFYFGDVPFGIVKSRIWRNTYSEETELQSYAWGNQ